ncbi:hypothetical protein [Erythrobacter insulae]|uniref:hypothetical protein n=1 Tax=Erythrobacter insulae TaxID=2584124 RepID=UPI00163DB9D8|nr:hypothetical protein [Erythrobacter insulae]
MKTLNTEEITEVSGAGEDGFVIGYTVAKALGASDTVAAAAGIVGSAIEDAVDTMMGE